MSQQVSDVAAPREPGENGEKKPWDGLKAALALGWLKRCWFNFMDRIPSWIKGVLLLVLTLLLFVGYEEVWDRIREDLLTNPLPAMGETWTKARQVVFFLWAGVVVYWGLWPPRPEDVPPLRLEWTRELRNVVKESQGELIDKRVNEAWQKERQSFKDEVESRLKGVELKLDGVENDLTGIKGST